MSLATFFIRKSCTGHLGQTIREENALLLTVKKADPDFMLVNFLVVDFRFESEFQSRDCLQHTTMMLVVWIRPLECSRKLSVRLCAAHLQKVAVQAMEGSSD